MLQDSQEDEIWSWVWTQVPGMAEIDLLDPANREEWVAVVRRPSGTLYVRVKQYAMVRSLVAIRDGVITNLLVGTTGVDATRARELVAANEQAIMTGKADEPRLFP